MTELHIFMRAVDGLCFKAREMTLVDKRHRRRIYAESSEELGQIASSGKWLADKLYGPDFQEDVDRYADSYLAVSYLADMVPESAWHKHLEYCPVCHNALVPISAIFRPDEYYCEHCLSEFNQIRASISCDN